MLVGERMSKPVITVRPDTSMPEALDMMRKEHIRRLPVVNEKHEVVGMLSLSDLVRKAGIEASVIAEMLQSICEPAHAAQQRTARIITAA